MVARVARFEGVNVAGAEETMDEAEALVRPLMEGLVGYEGYFHLLSRDGEQLAITFFDSAANAEAATPVFEEEMPRALGHLFERWEGHRVSSGLFEVIADSRS